MSKFNFTTKTSAADAQLRSADLAEVIKSTSLVNNIESRIDLDAIMPKEVENPYPVIILINGSGGCGKGVLIKMVRKHSEAPVYEISTVDPLRPVARTLLEYQYDLFNSLATGDDPIVTAKMIENEKGGSYRQLLSDLKHAWEAYEDGPNSYVVGTVLRLITNERWTVNENTGLPYQEDWDGGSHRLPSMIFINVREPDNLDKLKHVFWEYGLLCITMKMNGIEHDVKDLADTDLVVNDYDYDLVIRNKGTLDDLNVLAFTFNTLLNRANGMYGVECCYDRDVLTKKAHVEDTTAKADDGSCIGYMGLTPFDGKIALDHMYDKIGAYVGPVDSRYMPDFQAFYRDLKDHEKESIFREYHSAVYLKLLQILYSHHYTVSHNFVGAMNTHAVMHARNDTESGVGQFCTVAELIEVAKELMRMPEIADRLRDLGFYDDAAECSQEPTKVGILSFRGDDDNSDWGWLKGYNVEDVHHT